MKKALKGVSHIFIFLITANFISYLIRLIYARNLTTIEYGLFYAVVTFISFLTIFKEFGLNETLTKFISKFLVQKEYLSIKNSMIIAFVIQFVATGFISLIIIIFADYLAVNYFHSNLASPVLKLLAFAFWFDSLTVV
ncbi:oligosaccharide flippase family protein, partial [Candidatus Pacearchaeota archaeon]|nr:oligosaccharide flippase family protein [Candidatus Pacearchaeota archaeon]